MTRKPMSWGQTAAMFLLMTAVIFGETLAFYPTLRHQVGSIHSVFWQLAFPADLCATAILAIGMRFAWNRLGTCRGVGGAGYES